MTPAERAVFSGFMKPDALQTKVARDLSGDADEATIVALACGGEEVFASIGYPADEPTPNLPVDTGCTTKLFTATLTLKALEGTHDNLDTEIQSLLPATSHSRRFAGIRVRHLLEHTHGIDDSARKPLPRTDRGLIDTAALMKSLEATPPLNRPGELYSYSNVGAWIAAAFLEHRHGAPYSRILDEELLRPLGISERYLCTLAQPPLRDSVCPAVGHGLQLSVGDMLLFLQKCPTTFPDSADAILTYPGWSPAERGIFLGWKYFRDGWFGHQSAQPGSNILLRVHPRERIAIVISSKQRLPAHAAGVLFGKVLPEFVQFKLPRPLQPPTPQRDDLNRLPGIYMREGIAVSVDTRRNQLELRAYGRSGDKLDATPFCTCTLHPASDGAFYANPPHHEFPVMQFVRTPVGNVTHMWDGRFLWRRVT